MVRAIAAMRMTDCRWQMRAARARGLNDAVWMGFYDCAPGQKFLCGRVKRASPMSQARDMGHPAGTNGAQLISVIPQRSLRIRHVASM
jgi:hypothetical protein